MMLLFNFDQIELIEFYFSILGSEAEDKQHNRCVMCGKYASFYAHLKPDMHLIYVKCY